MNRAENLALGEWVRADGPQTCVYCGTGFAVGLDHVPPVLSASVLRAEPRWLYPACYTCNFTLGAYPVACLDDRAAFLLGRLRVRWLYAKTGNKKRVPLFVIEETGRAVAARLSGGLTRGRCRCKRCRVL